MKKIFGSKSQTNVYIQCANEAWEWDYSKKSAAVQIASNNLSASRPSADGNNPAILSTRPLNKYNPHFRIQVETIGTWVGIGVVDTNFTLNGGAIIGNQKDCINSSYFYQNSASLKLEGETEKNVDTKIEAGNIIDVYVDFDNDKILYWNNSEFLGYMSSSKIKQNKLFACANLSSNTKVAFLNRDAPQLPLPKDVKPKNHDNDVLMKPAYNYSITWKWSTSLKASSVVVSGGNEVASRPSTEGSNPAILAGLPLSSTHNHFRVQIQSMGKWIGIGFSEEKYQLNDGSTLGSQKECINCGYFQQDRSTLNLNDKERFDVRYPLAAYCIIDVLVDFNTNKTYFWNNDRFTGAISHSSVSLKEGEIYPCLNLSTGTSVVFLQNAPTPIIPSESEQALARVPATTNNSVPPSPTVPKVTTPPVVPKVTPTNTVQPRKWQWNYVKKADAVVLADDYTSASRPSTEGNNPAVLGILPLSRSYNHFRVHVKAMGKWVGIGFAEEKYTLHAGSTLGSQKECTNCGYFCQDRSTLNLSDKERFDVKFPIAANDIIDVLVDFNTSKTYFWNNERFVGVISHSSVILPENKIYPCVNLSSTTVVTLIQNPPPLRLPTESELALARNSPTVTPKVTPPAPSGSPIVPKVNPANNNYVQPRKWQWNSLKKADAVSLADDYTSASRPSAEGNNPAVLAALPLSRSYNYFRVHVKAMGKWVGIGFAEEKYALHAGSTLGSQKECVNCGYFHQDRSTLNLNDKERFDVGFPIMANDIIDVLVDFNTNKVYFWNNSRFVGVISHSSVVFQENKIYPCVNLSSTTVVTLLQNSPMPIIPSEAQQQVKTTVNTTPAPSQPVQPAPKPESPVPAKLNNAMQNLNLSDNNNKEPLVLLVEHESLKYPVKFIGNTLEELHEHIFKIVKPQRAFKIAYWSTDFEENLVLTDIRDLQNKMKVTLILTDQRPAEVSSSSFSLLALDKSAKEFDEVEMQFRADFQNHHEYYVAQRVKSNKLPITFVLMNAWKVVNPELENKFAYFYEKLKTLGRNAEELKVRRAYHGTRASNVEPICKNGLLKIGNPKNPSQATDPGWFGDPRKGVYVSRHVEYTTKYSNSLAHLEPNDRVKIIMFKTLPGKSFHVEQVTKGMSPTPGYDSHSSPSFLEWFLFDEAQSCPVFVLEVQALENTRVKSDDGSKH